MTLAEILGQVVLPALAAMGAGIGGGLVYAQRRNGHGGKTGDTRSDPPRYRSLPPVATPASAVSPTGNTGRYELDGSLGAMRCDRHQALEDAVAAAHVEAREFRAEVKAELRHLRDDVATVHAVTSELRDAALRAEAEPRRYPVGIVRGGAAVPR